LEFYSRSWKNIYEREGDFNMVLIPLIGSLTLIAGIILVSNITLEDISNDVRKILNKKETLKTKTKIARGKAKKNKIKQELQQINEDLTATGKGGQFATICGVSVSLFLTGIVFAIVMDNLFLVPVLGLSLAVLPFLYTKSTLVFYKKHIEEELETSLSVITSSYKRSDDLIRAVRENVNSIKPPIREIFKSFLGDAISINSNMITAITKLKGKIDNPIFKEWCDTLIQCQNDRTMKDTLVPVLKKLSDVRIVNSELQTILFEPKKEYFMMVAMVVGNIPLLFLLNKSWYQTLMHTMPGKIVLAVTGLAVFITMLYLFKFTKPIAYRR